MKPLSYQQHVVSLERINKLSNVSLVVVHSAQTTGPHEVKLHNSSPEYNGTAWRT